ncbi:hypothetical protein ACOME3_008356 [Neoechinorhynchus agilis]
MSIERKLESGSSQCSCFINALVPILLGGLQTKGSTRMVSMCLCSMLCHSNIGLNESIKRTIIERVLKSPGCPKQDFLCIKCVYGSDPAAQELVDLYMNQKPTLEPKNFLRKLTRDCFRSVTLMASGSRFIEELIDSPSENADVVIQNALALLSRTVPSSCPAEIYSSLTNILKEYSNRHSEMFDVCVQRISADRVFLDRLVEDCMIDRHAFVHDIGQSLISLLKSPNSELRKEGVKRLCSIRDRKFASDTVIKLISEEENEDVLEACIDASRDIMENDGYELLLDILGTTCFKRKLLFEMISKLLEKCPLNYRPVFAFRYTLKSKNISLKAINELLTGVSISYDFGVEFSNKFQDPYPSLIIGFAAFNAGRECADVVKCLMISTRYIPLIEVEFETTLNTDNVSKLLIDKGVEQTLFSVVVECIKRENDLIELIFNEENWLAERILRETLKRFEPDKMTMVFGRINPIYYHKIQLFYKPKGTANLETILRFAFLDAHSCPGLIKCLLGCEFDSSLKDSITQGGSLQQCLSNYVNTHGEDEIMNFILSQKEYHILSLLADCTLNLSDQSMLEIWRQEKVPYFVPHLLRASNAHLKELIQGDSDTMKAVCEYLSKTGLPIHEYEIAEEILRKCGVDEMRSVKIEPSILIRLLDRNLNDIDRRNALLDIIDSNDVFECEEVVTGVLQTLDHNDLSTVRTCLSILEKQPSLRQRAVNAALNRFYQCPVLVVKTLKKANPSLVVQSFSNSNLDFTSITSHSRSYELMKELFQLILRSDNSAYSLDVLIRFSGHSSQAVQAIIGSSPNIPDTIRILLQFESLSPKAISDAMANELKNAVIFDVVELLVTASENKHSARISELVEHLITNATFQSNALSECDVESTQQWILKILYRLCEWKCAVRSIAVLLRLISMEDFVQIVENTKVVIPDILLHRVCTERPIRICKSGFIEYLIGLMNRIDGNFVPLAFDCLNEFVVESALQEPNEHINRLLKEKVAPACLNHFHTHEEAISCLLSLLDYPGFLLIQNVGTIVDLLVKTEYRVSFEHLLICLLSKYHNFLTPYLYQLIRHFSNTPLSAAIFSTLPSRLLIPPCVELIRQEKQDGSVIGLLHKALKRLPVDQINNQVVFIRNVFVSLLELGTPECLTIIEDVVVKMSSRVFGQIAAFLLSNHSSHHYSRQSLLKLNVALSERLKNLFTPFARPILNACLEEDEAVELSIQCITSICQHDHHHELVIDDGFMNELLTYALKSRAPNETVANCCAAVFVSANCPRMWLNATNQIMLEKSAKSKRKHRILFIDCIEKLVQQLSEQFRTLIPVICPRLIELTDDYREDVSNRAKTLVNELHTLLGSECLDEYLK